MSLSDMDAAHSGCRSTAQLSMAHILSAQIPLAGFRDSVSSERVGSSPDCPLLGFGSFGS
jgi:hypothetical protein